MMDPGGVGVKGYILCSKKKSSKMIPILNAFAFSPPEGNKSYGSFDMRGSHYTSSKKFRLFIKCAENTFEKSMYAPGDEQCDGVKEEKNEKRVIYNMRRTGFLYLAHEKGKSRWRK